MSRPTPPARRPILLLVTGPSGGGKTTVASQLLAHLPELGRVVTCTTRPPRSGERDGVDYHFLGRADFLAGVERGEFLEHAVVYNNLYGTRRADVEASLRAGRDLIVNLDVQGAANLREVRAVDPLIDLALVTVFLTPVSPDELERRLRRRGQDEESVIQQRLAEARAEMREARACDYVVASGSITEDFDRVRAIFEAERWRSQRVDLAPWDGPTAKD